jgi:hypothetical protein
VVIFPFSISHHIIFGIFLAVNTWRILEGAKRETYVILLLLPCHNKFHSTLLAATASKCLPLTVTFFAGFMGWGRGRGWISPPRSQLPFFSSILKHTSQYAHLQ